MVAFRVSRCARAEERRSQGQRQNRGAAHEGLAALYTAMAISCGGKSRASWICPGSVGRFHRTRRMEAGTRRRVDQRQLRLAHPGRKTAAKAALLLDETRICGKSPLGDGQRRREPEAG